MNLSNFDWKKLISNQFLIQLGVLSCFPLIIHLSYDDSLCPKILVGYCCYFITLELGMLCSESIPIAWTTLGNFLPYCAIYWSLATIDPARINDVHTCMHTRTHPHPPTHKLLKFQSQLMCSTGITGLTNLLLFWLEKDLFMI